MPLFFLSLSLFLSRSWNHTILPHIDHSRIPLKFLRWVKFGSSQTQIKHSEEDEVFFVKRLTVTKSDTESHRDSEPLTSVFSISHFCLGRVSQDQVGILGNTFVCFPAKHEIK